MKIFLDTNIFLDLILGRDGAKEAVLIMNAIEKQLFEAYLLDITLLNIDYVAKKQVKDIRAFLSLVNETMNIVGANNKIIAEALQIENDDFEDSVQYVSAKNSGCTLVVTNDKKIYNQDIKICSSLEFIEIYING